MKNARLNNGMTYRCLSDLTGISLSRLCDIEHGREVPTEYESGKIKSILGNDISFATETEAASNRKELEDCMESISKVYAELKSRGFGKGNGGSGVMECPKCGDKLHFSVASLNGHVWGKCTTKGCLSWMQ